MSTGSLLPQVERLFGDGTVVGLPEAALLERFVARRDDVAFEALVARHGPLVLGVCRRLLRDPNDIEDAFQATFLVLVRKAGSIRQRELLGPWLYGVAYRVAKRSRMTRTRQRERESELGKAEAASAGDDAAWRELRSVLDEELARLPDKYRVPVVLCYLQGLTHGEAASRLGCPVGTVRSRLARGRERLGVRLTRRGLAPAAGLVGASIATQASGGALPLALSAATALAACRVAAGVAVKEVVSAESAALFERVLGTMSWKTVGKAALAMAAVGMLVVGAFFAGRSSEESKDDSALYKIKIPKTVKRPSLEPYPAYVVEPPDLIIVEVLDALPGRPISGEHLVRPDGTISLGFYGDVQVAGLTLPEIKEKVILHLRTFLSDEALGLWRMAQDQEMLETGKKRLESKYFKELKPPFTLPPDKSFPPDEPSPPPTSPLPPLSSDAHLFDKQAEQRRAEPNGEADMKPKAEARPTAETEGDSKPQADRRLPLPSLPPVDTKPLAGHQPEPKPTRPEAEAPPMTESGPEKSCETWVPVDPKDSNFVYVDMGAYNSKFYYVLGVTRTNGKFPCTGHETVLDAIENAGGLAWFAAPEQIRLIRPGKGNAPDQVFPIDYAAIAHGVDPSTNYQVFPGDRIVIPADPKRLSNAAKNVPAPASETGPQSATLGHRIEQLEKKLDAVLKALNKRDGDSTSEQPKRPKNEPKRDELDRKPNEA